jgi:hypothetical protein
MRPWILSVALCACVSRTNTAASPTSGSDAETLNEVWAAGPSATSPQQGPPPSASVAPLAAFTGEDPSASGTDAVTAPAASLGAGSAEVPVPGSPAALAEEILARPELAPYHGWIRYLQFRVAHAGERFADKPGAVVEDRLRFADWTRRILDNPQLLSELRGVTEWAYLSPVDGSGQPFKINIPTDYDPRRPAPVSLYLHGRLGNHLEDSADMREHAGEFEVSVLGRARGGSYRGLSEADVLAVLDYVSEHWAVDLDRVHLSGGGMGGAGTLWLGSRYPERFASGRPVCGSAADKPLGNLLTFPIYATHSDDDYRVPVLLSRGPLAKLRALGGNAILDETTGYGHAVWNYEEGNARAEAWSMQQVRPASREVKRLDFTALDGEAVRAFWAEIAEWGTEPRPARFALEVGAKNRVKARLENITSLRLQLAQSPIDPDQPLRVSIDGEGAVTLPAPLPSEVWLQRSEGSWSFAQQAPEAPFRLHTPGGANQLYDGEPLLIVYGTQAEGKLRAALRDAAVAASRSSNASWPKPSKEGGDDGVGYNQNLYGDLNIKADSEVTSDDIARRHLVLIGSAAQNSVVARLAARLPVRYESDRITWNDGRELSSADRALGLVHYNPDAPSRLIFWVAAADPAAYAAGSLAAELLGTSPTGADAVVVRVSDPVLVQSRSFDSRWRWLAREQSSLLPAELAQNTELARAVAETVRRSARADFAVAGLPESSRPSAYEPGEARLADLLAQNYFAPVSVMTLSGKELMLAMRALAAAPAELEPAPDLARIDPTREYRLALSARQIGPFVRLTELAPRKYEVTDGSVAQALSRYGVSGAAPSATPAVEVAVRSRPAQAASNLTTAAVGAELSSD